MKLLTNLVGIILFFCSVSLMATEVNGRFIITSIDDSTFSVLLQINTNTGTNDLGGTTIVFNFDTTSISFDENPVKNVHYTFHNFDGGNYSPATVTKPIQNKIWVNIDLPFVNSNNGNVVATAPYWTDVVTIQFEIINPNGISNLTWITSSPFWGIYDANNSNLWQTGSFENLFDPLPVELFSFIGTIQSNNEILIEWKTASSVNNAGFEIQKSYSNSQNWEVIGFVENYGDPNSIVEYSFIDNTIHKYPIVRYRLKSIDYDGSVQYSEVIEINTLPSNFELYQNYPNPFNPNTKIKYTIPFAESGQSIPVKLIVYDALGNEVIILVDDPKVPGVYEIEFNGGNGELNLASGIYIYRITAGNFVSSKKMILMK